MSYGQLTVLLLTFIIYTHTHKLSRVEDWGREHHHTLELSTGWQIGEKDLIDWQARDSLGAKRGLGEEKPTTSVVRSITASPELVNKSVISSAAEKSPRRQTRHFERRREISWVTQPVISSAAEKSLG